jgi:hypothetical protein
LKVVTYVAGSNCGERLDSQSYPNMCFEASNPNGDDDSGDDGAGDDGTNKNLPKPTVRGRIARTVPVAAAQQKAEGITNGMSAPRAAAKAKSSLRAGASDSKQALDLVPTDEDVTYDDDTADDDRSYSYTDDDSSGYAHDDAYYYQGIVQDFLNPPPSVSTTPFPTTTAEAGAPFSVRMVCQAAPKKSTVVFTAKQVGQ